MDDKFWNGLKAAGVMMLILGVVLAVVYFAGYHSGRTSIAEALRDTVVHRDTVKFVPPAVHDSLVAALRWEKRYVASQGEAVRYRKLYGIYEGLFDSTRAALAASLQDSVRPEPDDSTGVYTPVASADTTIGGEHIMASYWFPPVNKFFFDIEHDTLSVPVTDTTFTQHMVAGDFFFKGVYVSAMMLSGFNGRLLDLGEKEYDFEIGATVGIGTVGMDLIPLGITRLPDETATWYGARVNWFLWSP